MNASKLRSPRSVDTALTDKTSASTTASNIQHATPPRFYSNGSSPPQLLSDHAGGPRAASSAGMPQWKASAGNVDSARNDGKTALATSPDGAPSSKAHASSKRPTTIVSDEEIRRKQVMETLRLADATVILLDQLEAAIRAGNRRSASDLFSVLDFCHGSGAMPSLLAYTNYCVVADAVRSGNADVLILLISRMPSKTFGDMRYFDPMFNDPENRGCEYMLDIAAAREDLKIGLLLVAFGAKPGPNCPPRFLDALLKKAIDGSSSVGVRNLLGFGADLNVFLAARNGGFPIDSDMHLPEVLMPAFSYHLHAGNEKPLTDIARLYAGDDAYRRDRFDELVADVVASNDPGHVALMLKIRPVIAGPDGLAPTEGMRHAMQAVARSGGAAILGMLIDHQPPVRAEPIARSRHAMTPDAVGDNIGFINPVLDMRDEQGRTLLHLAAQSGNTETIALLLKRGANLTLRCNGGGWALIHAIKGNHIEAAIRLQKAAVAVENNWHDSKLAVQVALRFARPAMRAALANADPAFRPEPAAAAGALRPYAPYDDL